MCAKCDQMQTNYFIILIRILLYLGEQDARVLTLAEQIIAAMPDRIKVIFFVDYKEKKTLNIITE